MTILYIIGGIAIVLGLLALWFSDAGI